MAEQPAVTLDAFLAGQSDATAVRLEAGDDARALIPHLGKVEVVTVSFPTFRDGRGYSSARILREAGYTGELRAEGDVLPDQLAYMRRCGFDSFAPDKPLDEAASHPFPYAYQATADGIAPVWKLRHG
jgi:uncharacterized protein (DUF934 family)